MSICIKKAGDVVATPDWQLDRMYETDTERELERQYAEDDFPVSYVADEFSMAKHELGQAVQHLIRAANLAEKYGKHQKIDELIEKLDDDIPWEMDKLIKQWKEGS